MATTDVGAVLVQRLNAMPDKGLGRIKTWLRNSGQGRLADDLSGVISSQMIPDTLRVQLQSFNFTNQTRSNKPPLVQNHVFRNNGPEPQRHTLTYTFSDEQEFQFAFTEGLTAGIKVSATAKVPVGEAGVEVSGEFSFTAEQRWTYRSATNMTQSAEIIVPPNTSLEVKAIATYGATNAQFTADAIATAGVVMFLCRNRFLILFPVSIPVVGLLNQGERTVRVSGTMVGSLFLDDFVETNRLTRADELEEPIAVIPTHMLPQLRDAGLLSGAAAGL
jgi:hypothetical protein